MKNKNKLLLFNIILFITLFFISNDKVLAVTVNSNVSSAGGLSSSGGTCSSGNCFTTGAAGVRITLVDGSGTRQGTSIDYWFRTDSSNTTMARSAGNCYGYSWVYTKQMTIGNFSAPGLSGGYCDKSKSFININSLTNKPKSFSAGSGRETSLVENLINSYKAEGQSGTYKGIDELFEKIGYNKRIETTDDSKRITAADAQNLYLQFEPLIVFKNYGSKVTTKYFIGTISELMMAGSAGTINTSILDVTLSRYNIDGIYAPNSQNSPGLDGASSSAKSFANFRNGKIAYGTGFLYLGDIVTITPPATPTCDLELNTLDHSDPLYDTKVLLLYNKYGYNLLMATNYNLYNGGIPACKNYTPTTTSSCPASYSVDNCKSGKTIFSDNTSTSCWLDNNTSYEYSTASGTVTVIKSIEKSLGDSTYCPVYCYETFETDFPISINASAGLKSGLTFFWGKDKATGTFGKIRVTRTCQTKYNDYEKLVKKYVSEVQKMIKYYLMYQAYDDYYVVVVGEHGGACDGDEKNRCYSNKESYYSDGETSSINIGRKSTSSGCSKKNGYTSCDDKMYKQAKKYKDYYKEEKQKVEKLQQALRNCTGNQESISGKLYIGSKESSLSSVDKSARVPYNMNTNVYINYIDKIDVSKSANNLKLTKSVDLTEWQNKVTFNGCLTKVKLNSRDFKTQINYWRCSGDDCYITDTKPVINCDNGGYVNFAFEAKYSYVYPDTYKWYSKSDETVIDVNKYKILSPEQKNLTYFIGYGFPTSIKLSSGKYKISASVDNIGNNGHFNNLINNLITTGSTTIKKNLINNGYKFECTYEIDNDIVDEECEYDSAGNLIKGSPEYCDSTYDDHPGGVQKELDIVYRIIDLAEPFPGKNGSGRSTGSNWSEYYSGAYDDLFTNVYNKKPIYSITLDVATINQIRKSNKDYRKSSTGYKDPYTSYYDENKTLKIKCKTGTNASGDAIRYCASDYLTSLMVSEKLTGTCTKKTTTSQRAQSILNAGGKC